MKSAMRNTARVALCLLLLTNPFIVSLMAQSLLTNPLAASWLAQSLPLCAVTTTVYRKDGSRFAGAVITVHRVEKAGQLISVAPMSYTANNQGVVTFNLPRASSAWIEAPVAGFAKVGGVPVLIPDAANTTLATLATQIKLDSLQQIPVAIPPSVPQPEDARLTPATSSKDGIMTAADKVKIDGLGTASTRNTGTSPGNVPVLDGTGKVSSSLLPTVTTSTQGAM